MALEQEFIYIGEYFNLIPLPPRPRDQRQPLFDHIYPYLQTSFSVTLTASKLHQDHYTTIPP